MVVIVAYHRSFHLASTSSTPSFFFFFFCPPSRSETTNDFPSPSPLPSPLSSEPADDRLTFGLMALAGSRRWWMTPVERETFGAIRRFKRFFVTGARYVAAPAWPATMRRQKQCWLIAFQNRERWKTMVRSHRWWWVGRVFEIGARWFRVFFRDSKTEGEGRGAEERIRATSFASRKSAAIDDAHSSFPWFVHFSRRIHFIS